MQPILKLERDAKLNYHNQSEKLKCDSAVLKKYYLTTTKLIEKLPLSLQSSMSFDKILFLQDSISKDLIYSTFYKKNFKIHLNFENNFKIFLSFSRINCKPNRFRYGQLQMG